MRAVRRQFGRKPDAPTVRRQARLDAGGVGALAYNPVHSDYKAIYPRSEPFDLGELAAPIPGGWRRPALAADLATQLGRNCHLFAALCKLALRCSDDGLLTWARSLNREFFVPLAEAEVYGVWRSVCRYRARWRVRGQQARLAMETGRTGAEGRYGVRCGASGWLAHRAATVGGPWR